MTDLTTRELNTKTADALPNAGHGYWFRITLDRREKSRKLPILVELMECHSGNRRAMSRPLSSENTIASPKEVAQAAELLLARVIDYMQLVGDYQAEA